MKIATVATLVALSLLPACSAPTQVRAPESMLRDNSIGDIALYVDGQSVWYSGSKYGGRPIIALLSLPKSKIAIDRALKYVPKVLEDLGYEVVEAVPLSIGSYAAGFHLIKGDEGDMDPPLWPGNPKHTYYDLIANAEPVHRYEIHESRRRTALALNKLFSDLTAAIARKKHFSYQPNIRDVRIVSSDNGADTICLLRVLSHSHEVLQEVYGLVGVADRLFYPDKCEYLFTFIDGKTGEVLWQYALNRAGEAVDPGISLAQQALRFLPAKGEPMQGQPIAGNMIQCK